MKRMILASMVGLVLIGIVVAGAFTAVRLLSAPDVEADIPAGAMVLEDVFDDGSGNPVTVRTIIEPAAEVPPRPAEAAGVYKRQEDNSYFVGTGSISVSVNVVNGERSTAVDHSGPEIEVVVGRDTVFYRDVTEVNLEASESKEQRLQQEVVRMAERPSTIPAGANFAAWGEKRGDRVIADVVVISEQQ